MIGLKLDLKAFEVSLKAELVNILKAKVNAAIPKIQAKVRELVKTAIETSPTFSEIVNDGRLRGELGIPNPGVMYELLEHWVNNVQVRAIGPKVVSRGISLKVKISGVDTKEWASTRLPQAKYVTAKGETIPFLEWLLVKGDTQIIVGYTYSGNNPTERQWSRTGQGIQRASRLKSWAVPAQHRGTITQNFITRSLDGLEADLEKIIQEALK